MTETTRRAVFLGAGGAGLAAALTACSGYSTGSDSAEADPAGEAEPAGGSGDSGSGGDSGGGSNSGSQAFAKTTSIPEGGGRIYKAKKVVVTQPTSGEFKAFSVTCPHQGCAVTSVSGGTINCPCHGSKFNIKDGSVTDGPAKEGLKEKQITVEGGKISFA